MKRITNLVSAFCVCLLSLSLFAQAAGEHSPGHIHTVKIPEPYKLLHQQLLQTDKVYEAAYQSVQFHSGHERCGSSEVHWLDYLTNEEYRTNFRRMTKDVNAHVKEIRAERKAGNKRAGRGIVYTIPIVFHVMHLGTEEGAGTSQGNPGENISEEQIRSCVDNLTAAYRNTLGSMPSVDAEIEFCLATMDPDGNPTNGINRIDVIKTFNDNGEPGEADKYATDGTYHNTSACPGCVDQEKIKALSIWDHNKYYNVWVVYKINGGNQGGTQGYANFPTTSATEGTVVLFNAVGIGGTNKSFTNDNGTMIHELGHALALPHTFAGDGNGSTCPTNNDCESDGDGICDTPPHKRSTSNCNPNGNNDCVTPNAPVGDVVYNWMDYSSCPDRFTQGQVDVMRAVMENGCIGFPTGRACLSSAENLEATGCNGENAPDARFDVSENQETDVCANISVDFFDKSLYGPTEWKWSFEPNAVEFRNGTEDTSQNISVAFLNEGTYAVKLRVANMFGEDSITKTEFITVKPFDAAITPSFESCAGKTVTLTASGGIVYEWEHDGSETPSVQVSPEDTTTYAVFVIGDNGCEGNLTTTVLVNPLPTVEASVAPEEVCAGDTVQLSAQEGFTAYSWGPGGAIVSGKNNRTATASTFSSTDFEVTVVDDKGCEGVGIASLTVNAPPGLGLSGVDEFYCNSAAPVQMVGTPAGGEYSGPGVTGDIFDPSSLAPGEYQVLYEFEDNTTDCRSIVGVNVEIGAVPTASFTGLEDAYCENGQQSILNGTHPEFGVYTTDSERGIILGNVFNPQAAGSGSHLVIYTVTFDNGCADTAFASTVVGAGEEISINDLNDVYCIDAGTIPLSGTPAGGTFSGRGVVGRTFNPELAGPGLANIKYTVSFGGDECTGSTIRTVEVSPPALSVEGLDTSFCASDDAIALVGFPEGGQFSGFGVSNGTFNPGFAGPGTHCVRYSYTDDETGCSNAVCFDAEVTEAPTVEILNLPGLMCKNQGAIVLEVSPEGPTGRYSGPGMEFNEFSPVRAGAGTHNISYSFTDNEGCTGTFTQAVNVGPQDIEIDGLPETYCVSDPAIQLTPTPSGGFFSGPGTTQGSNEFDPSKSGAGIHAITYTFTDANNCSDDKTAFIQVNALPVLELRGLGSQYCDGGAVVDMLPNPAGGSFTGAGTFGNLPVFDPKEAGQGTHVISYTFSDSIGCTNTIAQNVFVREGPKVRIEGLDTTYCAEDALVGLQGFVDNVPNNDGVFSGDGVIGNQFSPKAAGVGTHVVSYAVNDGICTSIAEFIVRVDALPEVSLPDELVNPFYCQNNSDQKLSGLPSGGAFTSTIMTDDIISPSSIAVGEYDITYTYTDSITGCINKAVKSITIHSVPSVELVDGEPLYCVNNESDTFTANPKGGVWFLNGSSFDEIAPLIGGVFLPSNNMGRQQMTYEYFTTAGCLASATFDVMVLAGLEKPSINYDDSITLSTDEITGGKYQWYQDGEPIFGANSATYELSESGEYYVELYLGNVGDTGCAEISEPFTYIHTSLTNFEQEANLLVYPNPATSMLFIKSVDNVLYSQVSLNLYDMAGRRVYAHSDKVNLSQTPVSINVDQLTQGVYMLEIDLGYNKVTQLVSIQH